MATEIYRYTVTTAHPEYILVIIDNREDLPHTSTLPQRYFVEQIGSDDEVWASITASSLHQAYAVLTKFMKEAGL